jgi:ectoine hydroxylase-related dioxygenase (phytanoyl-CoA dioxygenase family)
MRINNSALCEFWPWSKPQEIESGLRQTGAVVLRTAIDGKFAVSLAPKIDEYYSAHPDDEFSYENGISGAHLRAILDDLFSQISSNNLASVARQFLSAEKVVAPINHLLFRRRDDAYDAFRARRHTPHFFHQDAGLIPSAFPMNVWIALSDVNEDCSGLSFILPCPDGPVPGGIDPEDYVARSGGFCCTPEMQSGDMLMFHRHTIHGSWLTRGKPGTRYSVEFRIGDLAKAPEDYASSLWYL